MACGLPTIGARHSGVLDFMNDQNSYLVDVEPWSVAPPPIGNPPGEYRWRCPKVAGIQQAMRTVYEQWKTHVPDPKAHAATRLRTELTPEKIGPKILAALRPYLE